MMNMKRLLSLILAFVMVLGMIPVPAFATEGGENASVDVVLSLSADDSFMVGPGSGAIMAMKDITVPYFDLALYGLEEYYFVSESYGDDGDGLPGSDLQPGTPEYAYGKVTLLHLYLYALEVFYCGIDPEEAGQGYLYEEGLIGTEVFSISGGVGSSFLNQFWGGDCNLNYYVNYEYPLASEGWGATSDQILLRDGDIITLGHFTGWSFYADPYSIFNYITADNENPVRGEEITLTLYYAGADLGATGGTAQNLNTRCLDVYCASVDDIPSEYVTDWQFVGTADENGELVVDTDTLEAGEYIFAVAGQPGDYTEEICSTPGGVRVTVEEAVEEPAVSLNDITIVVPDSLTPNETEDGIIYTGLKIFKQYTFSYVTDPEGLDVDVTWRFVDAGNNSTIDNADTFSASAYMNGMATLTLTATCGDVTIEKTLYITDKLPHEHSYEAVVTAPTCTEGGYTTYTCECGDSYIVDETAALGHTEEIVLAVAPTCTETGLTEGKKCSVCGETLVAQEVVVALGHKWHGTGCENCDAKRENPFTDVPEDSFYIDPVLWAVEEGITNGVTDTTFNPNGDLLRAHAVTMLWRAAGKPAPSTDVNPFTDVTEDDWYYEAVLWAVENGITNGISATKFDPCGITNRAQAVTFLWRFLDKPTAEAENPFDDVDSNKWYGKAVLWAVTSGITKGMRATEFGTTFNCNRAHMVTFLYRALA